MPLHEHICRYGETSAYREKGLDDVCLDGAERLVFDDNEDLLLFFQVDEVTKPGFFGKSVKKQQQQFVYRSAALGKWKGGNRGHLEGNELKL